MKSLKIGTATLEFDQEGNVTKTSFEPGERIQGDEDLLKQLKKVESSDDSDVIAENASLVLGSWWSKMNEIELADRDEMGIYYNVTECLRYASGRVYKCCIEFIYKKHSSKHEKDHKLVN